ncbi:hypothetical protein X772_34250 [Mesorhizobium sp. LSJC280B00]|nr:hypothetical protein X772_34250 [Mesorhizobium sp. LSJC280B00]
MKVIVQGFGNVGYHAAKFLTEEDRAKIICIVERDGFVFNPDGLDIEAVNSHRIRTGSILDFPGAQSSTEKERGLEIECDILIPAAMENAITIDNASRIRAKLVAEAANGPVSFQAERILQQNGIVILPDLFVNAGGVIVSYFEWVKNLTHIPFGLMERRRRERRNSQITSALESMTGKPFPEDMRGEFLEGGREVDLVRSGLDDVMRGAYDRMAKVLSEKPEIKDFRTAAYYIALHQIGDAYKAIGI